MTITWMSCDELRRFNALLGAVAEAAALLERADFLPQISLADGDAVIRCGAGSAVDGDDPAAGDLGVVEIVPSLSPPEPQIQQRFAVPEAPQEPAPAAPSPATALPPTGLIEGPLSDAEKQAIMARHAKGETSKCIGQAIARKPQTVGLFLHQAQRKAVPDATEKLPDAPPAVAVAPEAGPVAPAAGPVAPASGPAQAFVDHLRGLPSAAARRMANHLHQLPAAFDWSLADDLALCQAFARGEKLAQVAIDMGKDAPWVKQRYALITAPIRDGGDYLNIDGQRLLLQQLVALCACLQGAA